MASGKGTEREGLKSIQGFDSFSREFGHATVSIYAQHKLDLFLLVIYDFILVFISLT